MRLETTPEEKKMLTDTLDELVLHVRRLQMPILEPLADEDGQKSIWWAYEKRKSDFANLDRGIEKMADKLRPIMKDFFEKTLDAVTDAVDGGNKELIFVWYRMFDTFKYITAVTGKKRGEDYVSKIDRKDARAELTRRGLWKAK